MRLTDLSIKALKAPKQGAIVYPDDVLIGFGVRVSEGGTKSFVLTHGVRRQRETIGRVGVLGLQDARSEAKRRLAEYTLGKAQTQSLAWTTALDEYLGEVGKSRKTRTHKDYSRLLNRHFRFGATKLSDISTRDLQQKLDKLTGTPSEQHHAFVVLRSLFRWAHRKHYVETDPTERMKSSHRYRPRERILTDDELRKVWKASGDDSFGVIVRLLITTGQRVGEVTKLSRAMIGKDSITLPAELTKNGRSHTFPVAGRTLPLLRYVPFGALPNRARCKTRLDKLSGVTGWTLHDLRRTYASTLAALSVNLPVIERLLNHVSGSFGGIVGVYQRYNFEKEMRQAVEVYETWLQTLLAPEVKPRGSRASQKWETRDAALIEEASA